MATHLKKLAGQTATYGLSTVLAKFLNFLLTPYLTRLLAQNVYGEYTYMYTFIPFALVVLTMGLESGYFRFAGKAKSEGEKRELFGTTWGAVSLVSLVFMALVLLFQTPIAVWTGFETHQSYIWLVGAIIMVDAVTALPFARLREQGRAGRYVVVKVASVIINVVLSVFFCSVLPRLAENGILTGIYSDDFGAGYLFVANLIASVVALLMLLPSCDGIVPRIKTKTLKMVMVYSLPLLISGIAGTANEFLDRQLLNGLLPGDDVYRKSVIGVYGAMTRLAVVMTLFVQMYRMAAEPFFLAEFKNDDFKQSNAEAMKYYFIVTIFIFLFITLFSDLFVLILGRDFREGEYLLPLILLANMLSGVVLNLSFWYKQMEATKFAIIITCSGLVFTIGLNFWLIPRYEALGAAVSRLVCEAVMVVISFALNQKYFPIPYNLRRIGTYVLAGAVLYVIGTLCGDMNRWARWGASAVLCVSFLAFAVRREGIDVSGLLRSAMKKR